MKRYVIMDKKKITDICYQQNEELLRLLSLRDYDDEQASYKILVKFFEKLENNPLPPPAMKDDISEVTMQQKVKQLSQFREHYLNKEYSEALNDLDCFGKFSITFYEPSAYAMLLSAWNMVKNNDIQKGINRQR